MFDMKNLSRLKKLDESAPQPMKAFWAFDKAVFTAGALDVLTKQLMAVAVALTTQCPLLHRESTSQAAREAGARRRAAGGSRPGCRRDAGGRFRHPCHASFRSLGVKRFSA